VISAKEIRQVGKSIWEAKKEEEKAAAAAEKLRLEEHVQKAVGIILGKVEEAVYKQAMDGERTAMVPIFRVEGSDFLGDTIAEAAGRVARSLRNLGYAVGVHRNGCLGLDPTERRKVPVCELKVDWQ